MYNNDLYSGEAQALQVATNAIGSLMNAKTPLPLSNETNEMQNIQLGQYLLYYNTIELFNSMEVYTRSCAEHLVVGEVGLRKGQRMAK